MQANAKVEAAAGVRQADPGELAALSRLMVYVDQAALLMSAAFAAADIRDFAPGRRRQVIQPKDDAARWYADLTNDVLSRLSQVRHAVAHGWAPSPEVDVLATEAVALLAELTPVPSQIVALYRSTRAEGLAELARHLEIVDRQYALAASLIGRLEAGEAANASQKSSEPAGFAAAREALLAAAGGALSLTEAAQALGVSRQNLHKRIHTGSAVGMLLDSRIVVPKLQLDVGDGRTTIVAGLERVVRPFLEAKAGAWSALQFLLDPDPNLGRPPIDALRAGDVAGAEHAARAYLGLDEG
jgi:DNA-directed RNA polymerase specialized sigma24 family protein